MLEMCDILNEGTAEMPHFDPHGKTMLDALKTDLAIECARCDGRHIELAENDAYDGCVREACHRMKVKKMPQAGLHDMYLRRKATYFS